MFISDAALASGTPCMGKVSAGHMWVQEDSRGREDAQGCRAQTEQGSRILHTLWSSGFEYLVGMEPSHSSFLQRESREVWAEHGFTWTNHIFQKQSPGEAGRVGGKEALCGVQPCGLLSLPGKQ